MSLISAKSAVSVAWLQDWKHLNHSLWFEEDFVFINNSISIPSVLNAHVSHVSALAGE